VFVGYGAVAPEEKWDDYKGVDVKGKILVMMVNDPQPTAEEPNRFAGKAYTYYGRWMYKYEEALRQGAAGALLIHTTPSASYDWSVPATSFSTSASTGRQRQSAGRLAAGRDGARAVRRQRLRPRRAARPGRAPRLPSGRPQAEDARASQEQGAPDRAVQRGRHRARHRRQLKSEAVVYSAHWDHLGIDESKQGDNIWNGAIDNGSGVAALLAMAQAAVQHPAKRTQVFLWPAGEETGFLGSNAYIRNPAWPLDKTTADLNLDSMNFVGKTRDIGVPAPSAAACTRRPRWWPSAWA
jgi:Zn-dependent M28 family amino/carboxypeptidase